MNKKQHNLTSITKLFLLLWLGSTFNLHGMDNSSSEPAEDSGKAFQSQDDDSKNNEDEEKKEQHPEVGGHQKKQSYYEILGVPSDANQKAIKKAYRKLSRKNHPDKLVKVDLTEEEKKAREDHFTEANNAYGTLSDTKKKKEYDLKLKYTPEVIDAYYAKLVEQYFDKGKFFEFEAAIFKSDTVYQGCYQYWYWLLKIYHKLHLKQCEPPVWRRPMGSGDTIKELKRWGIQGFIGAWGLTEDTVQKVELLYCLSDLYSKEILKISYNSVPDEVLAYLKSFLEPLGKFLDIKEEGEYCYYYSTAYSNYAKLWQRKFDKSGEWPTCLKKEEFGQKALNVFQEAFKVWKKEPVIDKSVLLKGIFHFLMGLV